MKASPRATLSLAANARLARTGLWVQVADHDDLTGRPRVTTARRA